MSASEKLSIVGGVRKASQDFFAPELRELTAQLRVFSDNQKAMSEEVREGFKARTGGRQELEARLVREIRNSEEKLLIRIQLAEANMSLDEKARIAEAALREIETLKREKIQ